MKKTYIVDAQVLSHLLTDIDSNLYVRADDNCIRVNNSKGVFSSEVCKEIDTYCKTSELDYFIQITSLNTIQFYIY